MFPRVAMSLLALASLPVDGFAQNEKFIAREREMADRVGASADLTVSEERYLTTALTTYFKARRVSWNALLKILAVGDDPDRQAEAWKRGVRTLRSKLSKAIGGCLDRVRDPSLAALKLQSEFHHEEDTLLKALAVMPVAAQRLAAIGQKNAAMEDMLGVLAKKWAEIRARDDRFDEQMARIRKELLSDVDRAVVEAAQRVKTFVEKAARVADVAAKFGPPELAAISAIIKAVADKTDQRIKAYRDLVRGERGLFVIFEDVREDVERFVAENGLDAAREDHDAVFDWFGRLRSKAKTPGLRKDLEKLVAKARDIAGERLGEMEDTFNEFVAKNRGLFFGPVGPKVYEELLENETWDEWLRRMRGARVEAKLREWREAAKRGLGIELPQLTEEQRGEFRERLTDDLVKLGEEIYRAERKLAFGRINSAFKRPELAK